MLRARCLIFFAALCLLLVAGCDDSSDVRGDSDAALSSRAAYTGAAEQPAPAAAGEALAGAADPGVEFRVNVVTENYQLRPSTAMAADGSFVVVWDSGTEATGSYDVLARRYHADGAPLGGEFRVNTCTTADQYDAKVAMSSAGAFVVTWRSSGQDGSGSSVHAQRYDADGVAQGAELLVNEHIVVNDQYWQSVAMAPDGAFVVAWTSVTNPDTSASVVFVRRYAADGTPQGDEQQLCGGDAHARLPSVRMAQDGSFVVAYARTDSSYDVFAQRFSSSGELLGDEFRVNTYTDSNQYTPSLGMAPDGTFVVAWISGQDGDGYGIYAQRYNASGEAQGAELHVSTATAGHQLNPTVGVAADGSFVVAWSSPNEDDPNGGVYAQRYAADGTALGGEFHVNTYTAASQVEPELSVGPDGQLVVVWASYTQDGSDTGIYAKRYVCLTDGHCDDGQFCTLTDACGDGLCSHSGTPCADDGLFCDGEEICDESGDQCGHANLPICPDDGLYCDGIEACLEADQACGHVGAPNCSDGVDCNGVETCDEAAQACTPGVSICPDDRVCDPTLDQCVLTCTGCEIDGVCYGDGQANPLNACQVCNVKVSPAGWSDNDGASCDDGLFCNGADTCAAGACVKHVGNPCPDDGYFCNGAESCSEDLDACAHSGDPCDADQLCVESNDSCTDAGGCGATAPTSPAPKGVFLTAPVEAPAAVEGEMSVGEIVDDLDEVVAPSR